MLKLWRNLFIMAVALIMLTAGLSCNKTDKNHFPFDALSFSGIPPIPDSLQRSIAEFQNWNSTAFQDWLPDSLGMVVLTRSGQTNQIHFVAGPSVMPLCKTHFIDPVTSVNVCPDPTKHTLLFTRDSGGNENFQIFAQSLDTPSRAVLLTDGKSQNDGVVWSNKGDRFAFQSNRRNGADFDIFIQDINRPGAAASVLSCGGTWSALDWSPDDKKLLVSRFVSRTDEFVGVLDLACDSLSFLHDTLDTVSQENAMFGPHGKGVFLTSDKKTDFRTLRYYDCATRRERVLTASLHWDVREIEISKDRSLLAFMTNENGFSRVYLMNTATFEFHEIPGLPCGGVYHLKFTPDNKFLGMTVTTPRQPEEAYAVRLADFSLLRWTHSALGCLDTNSLVAPSLIHFPTFDSIDGKQRLIPCFYYTPIARRHAAAVMILLHGGPESQYWPYFSPFVQYVTGRLGIAVLAPNVRGSGGYGKKYLSLDDGYKRENAVKDVGALLAWITTQPALDTSRIAVMGGSYGGYLSLASMIRFSGRVTAGIDLYGISDFVTFLTHTSAYRRDVRRAEYGDERDPQMRDYLTRISPLTNASHIACPLFIIQGANDPRVPLEESRQIADAVRKNSGTVWMMVAKDEGHGFRKKSNADFQECAEAFFLKTFLLDAK